jgi:outer membrane protein assembly factor BamD
MAEQYYAAKNYAYAQQLYEDIFAFVKGTPRYEDMYYKFAYSYYYQKDYLNAENLYKTFVENFPTSPKAEECEYMRAFCYYRQSPKVELDQTNTNKTMQLMQAFINTHPVSARTKEATEIIDKCREKLELKEFKSAELYYNLGFYKAAAISFASVSDNFPDSKKADEYKLLIIKSYFKYAELSYEDKQKERYEKVLSECNDFTERFSTSKLLADVTKVKTETNNFLKTLKK